MGQELDVAPAEDADLIEAARRLVPVLRALGDENRLVILLVLCRSPRSVSELTSVVGISQTLVSYHLKALREVGLVSITARGRSNVYSVCCEALAAPVRLLAAMGTGEPVMSAFVREDEPA